MRFVSVYFSASIGGGKGGWDTHGDNFNQLKRRLLPITDQTMPTLIRDLARAGCSTRPSSSGWASSAGRRES